MSNQQIFNSGKAIGKAEEKEDHLMDTASSALSNASEATKQKGAEAMKKASGAVDSANSKASDAMDSVKSKVSSKK